MPRGKTFALGKRLTTHFPNFPLTMLPLSKADASTLKETGWLPCLKFKTVPEVNKIEIKEYVSSVYGLDVKKVNTVNVTPRTRRSGRYHYKQADWKLVYLYPQPPPKTPAQA